MALLLGKHLDFGEAERIGAAELDTNIAGGSAVRRDSGGGIGDGGLMAAPGAGPVLESGWRVGGSERGIRNEDPVIAQAIAAAIGAIPDDDVPDGCGNLQINLPPGVGIAAGVRCRAVEEMAAGLAIDRRLGVGGGVFGDGTALGGGLADGEMRERGTGG
jgi:hypothetical protein